MDAVSSNCADRKKRLPKADHYLIAQTCSVYKGIWVIDL